LYDRGLALVALNRTKEALKSFEEVLKLDPRNSDAIHSRDLTLKQA